MGDYAKRFQALVDSLKNIERVTLTQSQIRPPASADLLDAAHKQAHSRLPKGVEAFYSEMNGFDLEWQYQGTASTPDRGSIHLLPIESVFGDWRDATWFEGDERFRPVKPFDLFQPEACAAFCQKPNQPPENEVYFHVFGEGLCATGYTFAEYLDRLIAARGYFYWQVTLCRDSESNPEADQFFERMPILFPDFSRDLFKPGAITA